MDKQKILKVFLKCLRYYVIFVGVSIVLVSILVAFCYYGASQPPQIGINTTPDECPFNIPKDATNVDYYSPPAFGPNLFYEFDISEDGFRKWAKERKWKLREIKDEPYNVETFNKPGTMNPDTLPHIKISNGLFYYVMDGDAGSHVGYDRDKGRAYFHSHTR